MSLMDNLKGLINPENQLARKNQETMLKLYDILKAENYQFGESLNVLDLLRNQIIAEGTNFLNGKYLNHLIDDDVKA